MIKQLLLIEKIVLESINNSSKSAKEISKDTNLNEKKIGNILLNLLKANLIHFYNEKFHLNRTEIGKITKDKDYLSMKKGELCELLNNLVYSYYFDSDQNRFPAKTYLKIKKLWLNPREEIMYYSILMRLERFLEEVKSFQKDRLEDNRMKSKKVILVGHSDYSNILDSYINHYI